MHTAAPGRTPAPDVVIPAALTAPATVTLRSYADAWRARRAPHWAARTREGYEEKLRRFVLPTLGEVPLVALTRRMLIARFDELSLRLAPKTVLLVIGVVTALLNDAVDGETIALNPAYRLARRYRMRFQEAPTYTRPDVEKFLRVGYAIEPEWTLAFAVMAKAGHRAGEARAARLSDFDRAERRVTIRWQLTQPVGAEEKPKGGKTRRLPYFRSLESWLDDAALRPHDRLVPKAEGPHGYKRMLRAFRRIAKAAGLAALTPKALRHAFASALVAHGESIESVRRAMGHADVRTTTQTYGGHYEIERSPVWDVL